MTTFQRAQLVKSMQRLDWDMRLRHYAATYEAEQPRGDSDHVETPDAEQFWLEQSCPSDATFR